MTFVWLVILGSALIVLAPAMWAASRVVSRPQTIPPELPDERKIRELFDEHLIDGEELRLRNAILLLDKEYVRRILP